MYRRAASKPEHALRVVAREGELHAEVSGSGQPLLLVAGLGQGLWVWRYVREALARSRRTIVFDARGTGRSSAAVAGVTVASMAEDARAVLEGAEALPADVVGFSMGGYVALTLALTRPEAVRSLVLAGTGAGGRDRVPRPPDVRAAYRDAWGLDPAEYGRRTMPHTFSPGWTERHPDRFEDVLAARLERPAPYETIAAHAEACYDFYDEGCDVERILAPTLVAHGSADRIVPVENGRRLAERLSGAEYVELAGRGHNLMLEDPDSFSRLVTGFLGVR